MAVSLHEEESTLDVQGPAQVRFRASSDGQPPFFAKYFLRRNGRIVRELVIILDAL